MKKLFLILVLSQLFFKAYTETPDEGMWLPLFIDRLNYVDMQKNGLHLTAEELYNINTASLKDAIVSLGFFCTAEVVSKEGLIFTNHHCGYDAIQQHSTIEHDYLTDGFWAMSKKEELANEELTASFLVRIEDVTDVVLADVVPGMSESDRKSKTMQVIEKLESKASEDGKYDATVKGFFEGNEYYLFVYETYKDVRLVGAPPSSVGKFGGDTDNWMWPRHTGDFSIFRIYTAPDGSPAEYSENNIPLQSKYSLPISLKGVKKDDFAMVWGYPGSTTRYMTSYGINVAMEQSNPISIKIRDKKLAIIKDFMESSPKIKIQYASKYSESSNYWKYFIGQNKGLKNLNVIEKKQAQENAFVKWTNEDEKRKEKYKDVLNNIKEGYEELSKYNVLIKYLEEAALQGPEFIMFSFKAYELSSYLENPKGKENEIKKASQKLKEEANKFFKNYNKSCDANLCVELLGMFYQDVPKNEHPDIFTNIVDKKYKGSMSLFTKALYEKSIFVDSVKLYQFCENPSFKLIEKDLSYITMKSMIKLFFDIYSKLRVIEEKISFADRLYVQGLREMHPDKNFYPDANSTLRMSYGKVSDYYPADAVQYDFYTTLDGVFEKEDATNDEFVVSEKLRTLWKNKDYGRYANSDGNLNVCFISDLDITGGNSGSPVINGDGQLVGIAFDGNWEAMSGDIAYESELQRTISVDIRYVLFMIDKYAGAKNIIDELTIVQ